MHECGADDSTGPRGLATLLPVPSTERLQSVDAAKGIAIVLIVIGHVERGLNDAGVILASESAPWDRALYLVHLSVFALLAGTFTGASVERRGPKNYLLERLSLCLYLYVVWTWLQGVVKLALGSRVNSRTSILELVTLWIPQAQFWFLPWLAIVSLLATLARPWGTRGLYSCLFAVAISIAFWGWEGQWVGTQGLALLGFFFIGSALGTRPFAWLQAKSTMWLGAACAPMLATLAVPFAAHVTAPTILDVNRTIVSVALGIAVSTLATLGVLCLAELLARTPLRESLCYVGAHSLPIFLAHILFASGTRIALQLMGVGNPWAHMFLGVAAGLLGSLALVVASHRMPLARWLFQPPRLQLGRGSK